jgi:hypothetical protein
MHDISPISMCSTPSNALNPQCLTCSDLLPPLCALGSHPPATAWISPVASWIKVHTLMHHALPSYTHTPYTHALMHSYTMHHTPYTGKGGLPWRKAWRRRLCTRRQSAGGHQGRCVRRGQGRQAGGAQEEAGRSSQGVHCTHTLYVPILIRCTLLILILCTVLYPYSYSVLYPYSYSVLYPYSYSVLYSYSYYVLILCTHTLYSYSVLYPYSYAVLYSYSYFVLYCTPTHILYCTHTHILYCTHTHTLYCTHTLPPQDHHREVVLAAIAV